MRVPVLACRARGPLQFVDSNTTSEAKKLNLRSLARSPVQIPVGSAQLFLFRAGVMVAFGADGQTQAELHHQISAAQSTASDEAEETILIVNETGAEGVDAAGNILIKDMSPARLEAVAQVLAKSTLLTLYERQVADVFEQAEQTAHQFREGALPRTSRNLLIQIGDALIASIGMVGRGEVTEKPEVAWNDPAIDALYERLAKEFELVDRDRILTRKLALISEIAERHLNLLSTRRSLRVEWYIVALILFEIVLSLVRG